MTHDQTLKKHHDLFSDEYGIPSCAYLEITDQWLEVLDETLSAITHYLKENPYVDPLIITRVYFQKGLVIEHSGGDEATSLMVDLTQRLTRHF
jgi:hypothetical protein